VGEEEPARPQESQSPCDPTKKIVLVFFDAKNVMCKNHVPKGKTVNAEYVKNALAMFLKVLREKRPIMLFQDCILHWDNGPVNYAAAVSSTWRQRGPDDSSFSLFAGPCPSGLLPLTKGEV
jgi:hypothetical protein